MINSLTCHKCRQVLCCPTSTQRAVDFANVQDLAEIAKAAIDQMAKKSPV